MALWMLERRMLYAVLSQASEESLDSIGQIVADEIVEVFKALTNAEISRLADLFETLRQERLDAWRTQARGSR